MIEALVVGGGPAGATLATKLARAGREVVLLEREALPTDKVCGEFLSREATLYLTSLGLDLRALGAVAIDTVRLCQGDQTVSVPLPFAAESLSRRSLDEALLACAAAAGARVERGAKVVSLVPTAGRWTARVRDGSAVEARVGFLCTGKHDVIGHRRPPGLQRDLVAFKLHYRLSPGQHAALASTVELVLFDGGYAGLQPVEQERANLCLVVRRHRLRELGGFDPLLSSIRREAPSLDARLTDAEPCRARPLALSAIPYGHVRCRSDGLFRLGDQAAVIPSFSGDGMSIALHSADLAASAFLAGRDAAAYQRRLARDVTAQVLLATMLSQGLVRQRGQAALAAAARVWPGLVSAVAQHTRVSEGALLSTSAGPLL